MRATASISQNHFEEVMKEVPPIFAEPRKYNTARRRADDEARASGAPLPLHKTNKRSHNDVARSQRSQSQSVQPEDGEFDESVDGSEYGYEGSMYDHHTNHLGESPDPRMYDTSWLMDGQAVDSRAESEVPGILGDLMVTDTNLASFAYPGVVGGSPFTATSSLYSPFTPYVAPPGPTDLYAPILLPSNVEAAALPAGISFATKALSKLVGKGEVTGS